MAPEYQESEPLMAAMHEINLAGNVRLDEGAEFYHQRIFWALSYTMGTVQLLEKRVHELERLMNLDA